MYFSLYLYLYLYLYSGNFRGFSVEKLCFSLCIFPRFFRGFSVPFVPSMNGVSAVLVFVEDAA